jgi:cell shape-determining protein MreC
LFSRFDQIETENARLRFQLQENEAQRDKLTRTAQEYDRMEERFNHELERMTEKLQNAQYQVQ